MDKSRALRGAKRNYERPQADWLFDLGTWSEAFQHIPDEYLHPAYCRALHDAADGQFIGANEIKNAYKRLMADIQMDYASAEEYLEIRLDAVPFVLHREDG